MTDFFHSRPTEYAKKNQSFGEDDLFWYITLDYE
jgi:hypothetical protein